MIRRNITRRLAITTETLATADDGAPLDDELGDADERGPVRQCAVTRARLPKEQMIRFVIGPERVVVPDVNARLPGRGIWLSARGDVIEIARTKGAFARAARGQVTVPPDLSSVLQAALARRVIDHLGFARRAGQAVAGYQKAREWLDAGRVALVVQASDGSADERSRFLAGWAGRVPVVTPLDGQRLGVVFGRERAVHVVVAAGRLADSVRIEAERLAGLMIGARDERGPERSHKPTSGGAGADERMPGGAGVDDRMPGGAGADEQVSGDAGWAHGGRNEQAGGATPPADEGQGG